MLFHLTMVDQWLDHLTRKIEQTLVRLKPILHTVQILYQLGYCGGTAGQAMSLEGQRCLSIDTQHIIILFLRVHNELTSMPSFSAPHPIHSAPRHWVDWHRKSISYAQGEAILFACACVIGGAAHWESVVYTQYPDPCTLSLGPVPWSSAQAKLRATFDIATITIPSLERVWLRQMKWLTCLWMCV